MLNFSGRARRAEYWWFVLWTILAGAAMGGAIGYYLFSNPDFLGQFSAPKGGAAPDINIDAQLRTYGGYYFAANLVLFWLPGLAVTIRRLHDTDRSGAWYFIQLVPLIGFIWFLVLMCLPGTYGTNRFGGDSAPDRKQPTPAHPAFAAQLHGEERDRAELARRAAAQDYYKRRVLPSIQKV
ncbi:DUF805 domain-containing protein [Jannaschia sp. CCS1]|uniref:DUF805 domain-containing protein n=1 Tax=Jannaschia sp. (strain CCS1) TaxID=290400 RepID=UPI0002EBD482|nr:DUF805 domain-containing protein [Jannaschia sp. CCS1]